MGSLSFGWGNNRQKHPRKHRKRKSPSTRARKKARRKEFRQRKAMAAHCPASPSQQPPAEFPTPPAHDLTSEPGRGPQSLSCENKASHDLQSADLDKLNASYLIVNTDLEPKLSTLTTVVHVNPEDHDVDSEMESPVPLGEERAILCRFARSLELDKDSDDEFEYCFYCDQPYSETILLKRCSSYKQTQYCCKGCQIAHWPTHKAACKRAQADRTNKNYWQF